VETLDPSILETLALTGGIGLATVWLATRLNMLERKQADRRCPSCGIRVRPGERCTCLR
jgi:hypothetical protein